jgi:hypothetical protein
LDDCPAGRNLSKRPDSALECGRRILCPGPRWTEYLCRSQWAGLRAQKERASVVAAPVMASRGLVLPRWGSTRHCVWPVAGTGHNNNLGEPAPRIGVPWRRPESERCMGCRAEASNRARWDRPGVPKWQLRHWPAAKRGSAGHLRLCHVVVEVPPQGVTNHPIQTL